jgi:hypothetical protein
MRMHYCSYDKEAGQRTTALEACRLTPQFSGGALTYAARRERIMK